MINRRKALQMLSSLPLSGFVLSNFLSTGYAGSWTSSLGPTSVGESQAAKSIYESIGATPLINARGTVTVIGASRILPEVQKAMDEAVKDFVQLDGLMDAVAVRLAELTGAEWGIITSGASAAITAATAGCVTGGNPDKLWQIPDLSGMKDEVIIPSYSRSAYDAAARAVGVKMIEVASLEELKLALGPKTAMIMILAGANSEDGPFSLKKIAPLAKDHDVPVLVDAAAEGLEIPNPHLTQGADMVAYSGGKYLRGPQCAGLLIGRKDLVSASWINTAPHHGFGRGFKVGREEIMGMLAAVEMWWKRDHEEEWQSWISWLEHISNHVEQVQGVKTQLLLPKGRSNPSPSLLVQWDLDKIPLTGQNMEQILWEGDPRIAVSGAGSFLPFPPNMEPNIRINSSQLKPGQEKIIADRISLILIDPPLIISPTGPAAFDLNGQWDLQMKFTASIVDQRLVFEQIENELKGTHYASFGERDLLGSIYGDEILFRSSYTREGVRLNFEFTGKVKGDSMGGRVSMGEYGMADWKAKKRTY